MYGELLLIITLGFIVFMIGHLALNYVVGISKELNILIGISLYLIIFIVSVIFVGEILLSLALILNISTVLFSVIFIGIKTYDKYKNNDLKNMESYQQLVIFSLSLISLIIYLILISSLRSIRSIIVIIPLIGYIVTITFLIAVSIFVILLVYLLIHKEEKEVILDEVSNAFKKTKEIILKPFHLIIIIFIVTVLTAIIIYTTFFNYTEIDAQANSGIIYDHNNTQATLEYVSTWDENVDVEVLNEYGYTEKDYNSKISPIYDVEMTSTIQNLNLEPVISPVGDVYNNGDIVEITLQYDKEYAKEEKIKVLNSSWEIKIDGLYENIITEDITSDKIEILDNKIQDEIPNQNERYYNDENINNLNIELVGVFNGVRKSSYEGNEVSSGLTMHYDVKYDEQFLGDSREEKAVVTVEIPGYKQNKEYVLENPDKEISMVISEYSDETLESIGDGLGKNLL